MNETQLIKDLLNNYDKDARPVKNNSDSVKVELQMIYKELKEIVRIRLTQSMVQQSIYLSFHINLSTQLAYRQL